MSTTLKRKLRRLGRRWLGRGLAALPTALRFGVYRRAVDCDASPRPDLVLKIADTEAELEACFALLHDAYVASGFMRPHASGLRVTPYHALPTTTTLCAKIGEQVVGTLSIVRDGVFGFPMQTAFDISAVRAKPGHIAEISALAVHPSCRKTGGTILFPLMKFMYEYCTRYFDTRHLLIAVNPAHIEMYESLLFFRRLTAHTVDQYDFANGAPAVGATLDLHEAPAIFERAYAGKPGRRDLYRYFVQTRLAAIRFPDRPWHTSNDPVLTPALLDHFFNRRVAVLAGLDERRRELLRSVYPGADWQSALPPAAARRDGVALRRHPRFTFNCPAALHDADGATPATIVELSRSGFLARCAAPLRPGLRFVVRAELGAGVATEVRAEVVRIASTTDAPHYGFRIDAADSAWLRCAAWLEGASPATPGTPATLMTAAVTTAVDGSAPRNEGSASSSPATVGAVAVAA